MQSSSMMHGAQTLGIPSSPQMMQHNPATVTEQSDIPLSCSLQEDWIKSGLSSNST